VNTALIIGLPEQPAAAGSKMTQPWALRPQRCWIYRPHRHDPV